MPHPPTTRPATAHTADWSDPGLLSGRSRAVLPLMLALILVGSTVDTFAFKTTLDVFLREKTYISWGMAIGITVVAQLAAWTLGGLTAKYRHGDPSITRGAVIALAAIWVGLGIALCRVRWVSATGATASTTFGVVTDNSVALQKAHAGALLFLGLYLISGLVTAYEGFRVTNPWFAAYQRSEVRRRSARTSVVGAESRAERARLAAAHHSGEFDRDLDRRDAAIAERKALGAELANLARVLIASLKQDPSITDICSAGPLFDDSPGDVPRSARLRDGDGPDEEDRGSVEVPA